MAAAGLPKQHGGRLLSEAGRGSRGAHRTGQRRLNRPGPIKRPETQRSARARGCAAGGASGSRREACQRFGISCRSFERGEAAPAGPKREAGSGGLWRPLAPRCSTAPAWAR